MSFRAEWSSRSERNAVEESRKQPQRVKDCFVYILSNQSRSTIYIGVTSSLERRVWQHQNKVRPGFTAKYNCDRLIYYEAYPDPQQAIARESQLKKWRREKKENLINTLNPTWRNLSNELFAQRPARIDAPGSAGDSSTSLRRLSPTPLRSE